MLDIFTLDFWAALLSIVVIDLVLAGDNAIVIGLAARNVRKEDQKKVILWGMLGAVIIRILATILVVQLLMIPGLRLIGGLILLYIAVKLMSDEEEHEISAAGQMWAAVRTIIIADAMMGLDNVLAVAGAAEGELALVIIGLAISIPIMIWGSTVILRFTEKYPIIITIGAAVLAWTSSKMLVEEPLIHHWFTNGVVKYGFQVIVIVLVVAIGTYVKKKKQDKKEREKIQIREQH